LAVQLEREIFHKMGIIYLGGLKFKQCGAGKIHETWEQKSFINDIEQGNAGRPEAWSNAYENPTQGGLSQTKP